MWILRANDANFHLQLGTLPSPKMHNVILKARTHTQAGREMLDFYRLAISSILSAGSTYIEPYKRPYLRPYVLTGGCGLALLVALAIALPSKTLLISCTSPVSGGVVAPIRFSVLFFAVALYGRSS